MQHSKLERTVARTDGGTRRYSDDDLARLHRITELLAHEINLAGIARILDLEARNTQLEYDGIVKLFENTCGSVDVSGLCGGT